MSALATIIGGLGELSESELRQLYLVIGVRLGIPDVPDGAKPHRPAGGKTTSTKKPSSGKTGKKAPSSKGNPKRKSQWANHPLYQEYSRLKKVVEAQAKEAKSSFNSVDTAESRAYKLAFSHWLEAKYSFRDHRGGQADGPSAERKQDAEEASEEEEEEEDPSPRPQVQAKPAPPPAVPKAEAGKASSSSPKSGLSGSSTGKGKHSSR